jgi:hypothetical protein
MRYVMVNSSEAQRVARLVCWLGTARIEGRIEQGARVAAGFRQADARRAA